jgi:transposase
MKKILAFVLTALLLVTFTVGTVFAAPSPEAEGVISGMTSVDKDGQEGCIILEKIDEKLKDCFEETNTNNSYSSEFKMIVIKEYLEGKGSSTDIAAKYNITYSMVISWVNKYNNGEEIKDYDPKSEVYSMKSRKTTLEERIEIVKYALDNNNDYKGAADKFLVPYANVYNWVKMYNKQGEEGLKFHRGRPKNSIIELTELEKKDLEIAKLKLELEKHKRAEEIL